MPVARAVTRFRHPCVFASRRIAHLAVDAFYASVELLRYPELRSQAVAIGGGRNGAAASAGEHCLRGKVLQIKHIYR